MYLNVATFTSKFVWLQGSTDTYSSEDWGQPHFNRVVDVSMIINVHSNTIFWNAFADRCIICASGVECVSRDILCVCVRQDIYSSSSRLMTNICFSDMCSLVSNLNSNKILTPISPTLDRIGWSQCWSSWKEGPTPKADTVWCWTRDQRDLPFHCLFKLVELKETPTIHEYMVNFDEVLGWDSVHQGVSDNWIIIADTYVFNLHLCASASLILVYLLNDILLYIMSLKHVSGLTTTFPLIPAAVLALIILLTIPTSHHLNYCW